MLLKHSAKDKLNSVTATGRAGLAEKDSDFPLRPTLSVVGYDPTSFFPSAKHIYHIMLLNFLPYVYPTFTLRLPYGTM